MDSLERLQGLYADLVAFNEKHSNYLDRLWHELEDSLAEFRALLDNPEPTNNEREAWRKGTLQVDGEEYGVSDKLRELSFAIGKDIGLEEEEAGRLVVKTGQESRTDDDEILIANVISRFHNRRDLVLQNLRMVFQYSQDLELSESTRLGFQDVVKNVLDTKKGPPSNASTYFRKCLDAMVKSEQAQAAVAEKIQSKAVLSQLRGQAFYATLEFQKNSLFKQHEALGAIMTYMFRGNYTISEDLRKLHALVKGWQRLDMPWIHYLPAFSAAFRQYGSPDGSVDGQEALQLNKVLAPANDTAALVPRPLQALLELWWTAEHSGFYRDNAAKDPDLEKRGHIVKKSLSDGALELMLSICAAVKVELYRQPARHELTNLLVDAGNFPSSYGELTSTFFTLMLMESFESFAEAWITNMPDSIRQLKSEEDDQRLAQLTAMQDNPLQAAMREVGPHLRLEAFLVLIAFAFEDRDEAAEQFWEDPDSNLYGFVQWASRRQTVPRVGAFCEMLCAISGNNEGAQSAHKFLLEDSVSVPNVRGRKLPSLSYQQIFAELEFYARRVHERQPTHPLSKNRVHAEPELNESESPVMLASYLRLLTHLCQRSDVVRAFILDDPNTDLPKGLLQLSSGSIPPYLRASIFTFLGSLLVEKTVLIADRIWAVVDDWASTTHDRTVVATPGQQASMQTHQALQQTLNSLTGSLDQADAFVRLICDLVAPFSGERGQPIPFPPDLGASYRVPGVAPYVDFVCAQITSKNVSEWADETHGLGFLRCFNCINFMCIVLGSFNENYVTKLDGSAKGASNDDDFARMYSQRHPFGRTMQWLFSDDLNKAFMRLLQQSYESVLAASRDDPQIMNLRCCLDLLVLTLDLQPTFFDIIKPRMQSVDGLKTISMTGLGAIEDSIIANSQIILCLCQYTASENIDLALRSLGLLQRLSGSPKLHYDGVVASQKRQSPRHMVDMLGPFGELNLQTVSQSLAQMASLDFRELEFGAEADGYLLKDGILAFLNVCLAAQTNHANLGHLLLGFGRVGTKLSLGPDMENAQSLFDEVVNLATAYPDAQDGVLVSWLIHVRASAIGVLNHLWTLPVSTDLALTQLRRLGFFSAQMSCLTTINQNTMWDGEFLYGQKFWFGTSAEALAEFLSYRTSLYDYISRELRSVMQSNIKNLQQQYFTSLKGRSTDVDGTVINHASIFDLFDFAEIDTTASLIIPELQFFYEVDVEAYKTDRTDTMPELYDVDGVQAVLLRVLAAQEQEADRTNRPLEVEDAHQELGFVLSTLHARNRYVLVSSARLGALRGYVSMVTSVLDCCPMDNSTKTQFTLQLLQLFLPKLDTYMADGSAETIELTKAADALLFALSSTTTGADKQPTRIDITISEKLFQLFRICTEGIPSSSSNPELRTILYSICTQYLTRILSPSGEGSHKKARSNAMDCVRSAGSQLISILADDAEDGLDTCRLHALDLLARLIALSRHEKSTIIIDQLVQANILEILLEPIKDIVGEFQITEPKNRHHLLTIHEQRTYLLLQISLTRQGASSLLDAGLMQTLRDSLIFTVDPDIGLDLAESSTASASQPPSRSTMRQSTANAQRPHKSAITSYFTLLSSLLRLLLSTFMHFGPQNEKAIAGVRAFLAEYRGNMVGVFKRAAGINGQQTGTGSGELVRLVDECVRCYAGLVAGSGFVEEEAESGVGGINGLSNGMGRSVGAGAGSVRRNGGFT